LSFEAIRFLAVLNLSPQVYRTYIDVVHFKRLGKRTDKDRRTAEANIESEFFHEYEETDELVTDVASRNVRYCFFTFDWVAGLMRFSLGAHGGD